MPAGFGFDQVPGSRFLLGSRSSDLGITSAVTGAMPTASGWRFTVHDFAPPGTQAVGSTTFTVICIRRSVTVEEHGRRQRLTVRLTQHVFTDQAQPGANTFTHACDQHTTTLAAGFSLPEGEPVLVDTAASSRARGARWLVTNASSTQAAITKALICFSGYQIGAGPPSSRVTISEDDTWAHKQAIGKGTICINVRTTPAQASATVTLSGPNGYRSTSPKMTRLIDGARQFTSPITQQGNYTKTITVYDPAGNRTATTARTFTVTPPPQNGPPTQPACDAPTH